MKNQKSVDVQGVIDEFLLNTPEPDTADWKMLIDKHPEFASDIAQAAMEGRGSMAVDEDEGLSPADRGVYNRTISKVLNLVHSGASAELDQARAKVQAIKGPAARVVAKELGLGVHVSLLNRVMSGRTRAPRKVLKGLAARLDISLPVLSHVFASAFAASEVPAYKSTDSKPQVTAQPQSWSDAVAEFGLSQDEANVLLKLDEESDD